MPAWFRRAGAVSASRPSGRPALLIAAFLCLSAPQRAAADDWISLSQYLHTAWRENEGAALPAVNALAQTKDGYLWLGTAAGLLRFDGIRFSTPDPAENGRLPSRDVRSLAASSTGGLWIGTTAGICRLERGRIIRYPETDRLLHELTFAMLEDFTGVLWTLNLVNSNPVLASMDSRGAVRLYGPQDGVPPARLTAIFRDRASQFWIGTGGGLCRWMPGRPAACSAGVSGRITAIVQNAAGDILAGDNAGRNILRYRDGRLEPLDPQTRSLTALPKPLLADSQGNLWIGTIGHGLLCWREGRLDRFTRNEGLSSDLTMALFEDRESNIWVATANGLDRFRPPQVRRYTTSDGLSSNVVTSVAAPARGGVWIGTVRGGLNHIEEAGTEKISQPPGLPSPSVLSLFADAAGRLWIGTAAGLAYLARGQFHAVHQSSGENLKAVFTIAGDPAGTVWAADGQGHAFVIRHGDVSPLNLPGSEKLVYRLYATRDGSLWAGFFRGGLTRLSNGAAVQYGPAEGVAGGAVHALYEGDRGVLWVATASGLSSFQNGRWTTWTARDGLPADIQDIVQDRGGGFWMLAGSGLYRLDRAELDRPPGAAGSLTPDRFGSDEGVRAWSNSTMTGRFLALALDGRLWIGTEDGVAVLDPARLRRDPRPPPVIIEQLLVDGRPSDLYSPAGISFRGREVQIGYTAPTLIAPEGVRFRYRLDKVDRDWTDAGTRRTVAYVNLSPGRYRFQVIARNRDGVWNQQGSAIDFRIDPYFYQTPWFYALCAALMIAAAWAADRLRIRRIISRVQLVAAERARVTRELHDSLLQGFSGVVYQLEAASKQFDTNPAQSRQRLDKAIENADRALLEARRILMMLRIPDLEIQTLPEAIRSAGVKLVADTPIGFHLTVKGAIRELEYDAQAALYLIAREAVSNAVAHAQPRHIAAELLYSEKAAVLSVQDDGIGFEQNGAAPQPGHWGVPGMEERAKILGGDFTLDSAPGQGTRVTVRLPRRRA